MQAPNHCHISNRFTRQAIHTKFQMSNDISNETSGCVSEYVFACVCVRFFFACAFIVGKIFRIKIWKTNQSRSRNEIFSVLSQQLTHRITFSTHRATWKQWQACTGWCTPTIKAIWNRFFSSYKSCGARPCNVDDSACRKWQKSGTIQTCTETHTHTHGFVLGLTPSHSSWVC